MDDVKPLVVTKNLSPTKLDREFDKVHQVLEDTAEQDHLNWDPKNDAMVNYGRKENSKCKTLRLLVNQSLDFKPWTSDHM